MFLFTITHLVVRSEFAKRPNRYGDLGALDATTEHWGLRGIFYARLQRNYARGTHESARNRERAFRVGKRAQFVREVNLWRTKEICFHIFVD